MKWGEKSRYRKGDSSITITLTFLIGRAKMKEKILVTSLFFLVGFKTREDAISSGRRPCKVCKP